MPDRRRSAAYRIALTHSAAFALAIAILGVLVYFAADAAFRRQQDTALAEASADLVRQYHDEGAHELAEAVAHRGGENGVITFAASSGISIWRCRRPVMPMCPFTIRSRAMMTHAS